MKVIIELRLTQESIEQAKAEGVTPEQVAQAFVEGLSEADARELIEPGSITARCETDSEATP